jgi:hypothetical protein
MIRSGLNCICACVTGGGNNRPQPDQCWYSMLLQQRLLMTLPLLCVRLHVCPCASTPGLPTDCDVNCQVQAKLVSW